MSSVSNLCQMSLLKKYYQAVYDGEVTSKLAYERLKNSYDYLSYNPKIQKVIEPYNIYEEDFAGKLKTQYAEADLTHYNYHLNGFKIVEPCFVWEHIAIDGILLHK